MRPVPTILRGIGAPTSIKEVTVEPRQTTRGSGDFKIGILCATSDGGDGHSKVAERIRILRIDPQHGLGSLAHGSPVPMLDGRLSFIEEGIDLPLDALARHRSRREGP